MKSRWLGWPAVLLSVVLGAFAARAQNVALLPDAQSLFSKGQQAVSRQDWIEAISDFSDARKLVGNDPRLLLNLGIAQAMAGHEITAVDWLNAYRIALPDADNRTAVENAVRRLKQAIRAKVFKLFSLAKDRLVDSADKNRIYRFQQIADDQAALGDFLGATATLRLGYEIEAKAKLQQLQTMDRPFSVDLNRMRTGLANNLAVQGDAEGALAAAKLLPDEASRQTIIQSITSRILQGARFRSLTTGEIQKAQTYAAMLTNGEAKAKAKASIKRAILSGQIENNFSKGTVDHGLIEQYGQLNPNGLTGMLRRVAETQINKKDFAGAEATLQRIENFRDSDRIVGMVLPYLAEKYLEAGRKQEAAATARKLAAWLDRQKDKDDFVYIAGSAVVKAFDGEYSQAVAIAEKLKKSFYQIWTGDPDYIGFYRTGFGEFAGPELLIGTVAFCAAMNGREHTASNIAKQYSATGEFQLAYTNVAYAQLLHSQPDKTLLTLNLVPLTNLMALLEKSQLLGLVIQDAIKRDDLAMAQRAAAAIPDLPLWKRKWTMGARFKVEAALLLATTSHKHGDANAATRFVQQAKAVIIESQNNVALQRLSPNHLDNLLERVAVVEDGFGENDAAAAMRRQENPAPPQALQAWLNAALSGRGTNPDLLDPDKKLASIRAAKQYITGNITLLAGDFGSALLEIGRLERETGLPGDEIGPYENEDEAWRTLSASSPDAVAYRAYLAQFPDSARRSQIEKRIALLGTQSASPKQAIAAPRAKTTISTFRRIGSDYSEGVAYSPDGSQLAIASKEIAVWDVASGRLVRRSEKLEDRYRAIAFSPDGRWLLADGDWQRGILKLLDAKSGNLVRTLSLSEYNGFLYSLSISFSTDSRYFVTSFWTDKSLQYGVKIVETQSGNVIQTFSTSSAINSVALSPDNRQIAAATRQLAGIWDTRTGKLLYPLSGHTANVVAYSPDGRRLVTGSSDKTVRFWDPKSGKLLRTIGVDGEVRALAISRDARFVAALVQGKAVTIVDMNSGEPAVALTGDAGTLTGIAFSPDGRSLAASTSSGAVVWSLDGVIEAAPVPHMAVASIQPTNNPRLGSGVANGTSVPANDIASLNEIRQRLYELNFDPGPLDGPITEATREAIREFEEQKHLSPTGAPTMGLLRHLREVGALKPWGTIVYDSHNGRWGMAWDQTTRKAAVARARESCGGANSCPVEISFFGTSCAAFAYSKLGWAIVARDEIGQARHAALSKCRKRGRSCEIVASICANGTERFSKAE